MKKLLNKSLLFFIILMIIILPITSLASGYVNNKYISSSGACVMDYETGEILYELNGYTTRVPASMTKVMTLYCVYNAINEGKIGFDTIVPISQNVYNRSRNQAYQHTLPLYYNQNYTVSEFIDIVIGYSASGAAVALAELVGGSESNFANIMNRTAERLKINAHYYDCSGYADNKISPISMCILTRTFFMEYPDILERSKQPYIKFRGGTYTTTNELLTYYKYDGADGLKTGTGTVAGNCFCGTASRNGNRVITVTMGSSSDWYRFNDTKVLLDYGFLKIDDLRNKLTYTNLSTKINGYEVPTFMYNNGNNSHSVILVEDLKDYGFDITYFDKDKILVAEKNNNKQITPIPINNYKNKNGQLAYKIYPNDISVYIKMNGKEIQPTNLYKIDGYIGVSVDEFQKICGFSWNQESLTANINTNK